MSNNRPLILVTNDDGISANGIRALFDVVQGFGDVVVIAPDSPQSGMGHAITIHDPLRLKPSTIFPVEAYACSGTPVDCVKLGIFEVLHKKPDLIVSGVNHGANTATNVLYSGTMSAAVEGAMERIPSIGFSLDSFESEPDYTVTKEVIKVVVEKALMNKIPDGCCLNVNIPNVAPQDFKGIKVCNQAHAYWEDRFDKRIDQYGKPYYWLTGDFKNVAATENTDLFWIDKGYATVVPTQFDLTANFAMETINNWDL